MKKRNDQVNSNQSESKKGLSRRDFLKSTAAGAVSVAALGLLGGCSDNTNATTAGTSSNAVSIDPTAVNEVLTQSAPQSYTPGTYTASAYGNISYITVETTFSETEITGIVVTEQGETAVLFSKVEEELIPSIIDNQSLGVDAITGATNSSKAVIEAVADCVDQAGGDSAALLNKAVEKTASADEEYDVDIAIVGCGASGFMAANIAAKEGAKVIIVEKGSSVAAVNGIKVSGPFAVGTSVLEEINTTLTVDDAFYHVMEYSHWTPDAALIKRCLETSKDAVDELMSYGYTFQEANFRFETPFKGEKGGFHLIQQTVDERVPIWENALSSNGVEVLYNTSAKELIMENDKAAGFVAYKDDGTKVTVNAKAVIVASGGYLGNRDMLKEYLGTSHVNVASGGDSLCVGDGISMGIAAGVALDKTFGLCGSEYGGTNTLAARPAKQDKYDQNMAFKFGVYGCLLVDARGNRFMNEGLMCDYPMSYGSEPILRHTPYYAVVDSAYVDAMATQGLYEYTTAKGASEETWFIGNYYKERILTTLYEDLDEAVAEGWAFKADTIEELAEFFGLENLAETVAAYNEYCDNGEDPQFGANPWYLSPVKEGPFYVTQNEPSAWSTFGGMRTDENCRALTSENMVVEGLYVTGTDSGSLYYSPYYDIPGFCYGLCIDSGVIAGREAAEYVKE